MPFINVKLLEGRTVEEKRALVQEMSKVVTKTLNIDNSKVFIFLEDLKKEDYGKDGDLFSFKDS